MLEQVRCPDCGASLKVARSHLGGKVMCPTCQSIVVIGTNTSQAPTEGPPPSSNGGSPLEKHRKAPRRRVMVSSAFGFLVIVAVATFSGWYSLFLSKQHHFRKTYYEPAIELLTRVGEAVESIDGYALDDLFAEGVNETKRGIMLSTAAELRNLEFVQNPRITARTRDPKNAQETVELEVVAKDKELGTQRIVTLCIERVDGRFQLADLVVDTPAEEQP